MDIKYEYIFLGAIRKILFCITFLNRERRKMAKKQTTLPFNTFTHSNPSPPTSPGLQTICKLPGYHSPCFILASTFVSHQNNLQCLPPRIALLLTSPLKAKNKCVQSGDRHPSPLILCCGWGPLGTRSHTVQMLFSAPA